ncbi:BZ3500_MvSof-1268-A1-R1_Chr3-1g06021 [Microbotryum saponariae]|uniref:DASH complex subunit ASK1 n=1 Tax=Microbotryum saponariae TaxID=289078 RepID=A0A2X0LEB3_9BASI|nr:BZ3500_MvSof-1268-A1-R1_Chr3-1g06021 [Microbotryum saponariae]SDA05211.1 BZ3501_MvSof-1269-A2-R1_Chr3-1g05691 [Microbotryum saponariae]
MSARSRLFYDANNPVMLCPEEIVRLTLSDVQAASDQIDQNMVLLLQRIEENFDKCNQVVIGRILPAVQQHGENSRRIYESVKFWRPFFENAARIKLTDPFLYDDESASQDDSLSQRAADQSLSFDEGASAVSAESSNHATPRAPQATTSTAKASAPAHLKKEKAVLSDDMSPFQSLQADLHKVRPSTTTIGVDHLSSGVQRVRLGDLPPDSPDVPTPEWETATVGFKTVAETVLEAPSPSMSSIHFETTSPETLRKLKQPLHHHSASPTPANSTAASQNHPALLEKILRKNIGSPGPSSSTPGRGKARLVRPTDVPRDWDGLVDLSNTSLAAFASPIKRQGDMANESGWDAPVDRVAASKTSSPAPLGNRSLASLNLLSPAPSRVPAKQAAQRMTNTVYSALHDSPLEPPLIMREYTARLMMGEDLPAPSPSEGSRRGFEEEALEDEGDSLDLSKPFGTTRLGKGTLLAEFGGGTTARIDDLLNETSFARIVDDGDDFGTQRVSIQDDSFTDDLPTSGPVASLSKAAPPAAAPFALHGQRRDAFNAPGRSAPNANAIQGLDGREDTLFGMRPAAAPVADQSIADEDDSFAAGLGATQNFRMLGPDNLDTLHGGVLLESEPFESSPLANRDRNY